MNNEFIPVSQPSLSDIERKHLLEAFDSTWISSTGQFLEQFESRFAKECEVDYALAVSNGTVALHLALAGLGIGPGDEVIVPSLTYIATANAVRYCGAEPVFADVCDQDWGIDPASVEAMVGPRTRAVIAVHLYGFPAHMRALREVCNRHGLKLIEDAAEAPFASRDGQRTGSMGDVATFSFYGNKVITSGEGGAVTTNDAKLAARMRLLRGQGMDPQRRYWFPVTGYNFRLTNLAAAILCGQLDRQDEILERRRAIFARYRHELSKTSGLSLQPERVDIVASPWLFCVLVDDAGQRDPMAAHLLANGIDSRPFFIPLHTMPPYRQSAVAKNMDVTLRLAATGLNLPTFPDLSLTQVDRVIKQVCEFMQDDQL